MKMQALALAWFREDDFPRWRSIDRNFEPDYQHWLRRMDATFTRLKATGAPVVKVVLDPDEFLAWSNATGAGIGTKARSAFVAIKARSLDHRDGKH